MFDDVQSENWKNTEALSSWRSYCSSRRNKNTLDVFPLKTLQSKDLVYASSLLTWYETSLPTACTGVATQATSQFTPQIDQTRSHIVNPLNLIQCVWTATNETDLHKHPLYWGLQQAMLQSQFKCNEKWSPCRLEKGPATFGEVCPITNMLNHNLGNWVPWCPILRLFLLISN